MIDWTSCQIPFIHTPIDAGQRIDTKTGGEINYVVDKFKSLEGSYSKTINVRSKNIEYSQYSPGQKVATILEISGNPSKFLQGHNVFGSDNLLSLVYDTFLIITSSLSLKTSQIDLQRVREGQYKLTRVDVNYMYQLRTRPDVLAFIKACEHKARTRTGHGMMKGHTLTFNKKSGGHYIAKFYSKGQELEAKGHELPEGLQSTLIKEFADNKLRYEFEVRRKELKKRNLHHAYNWKEETPKQIHEDLRQRLKITGQLKMTTQQLDQLPPTLKLIYNNWEQGIDLRPPTLPKSTFYKRRRQLLEYGIDIALHRDTSESNNIVPLIKVLEASPVSTPDWAFHQQLVHHSATA